MQVIVIASNIEKTGKTTLAVNLAAGMAMSGSRCVIVDFDPKANASVILRPQRKSPPDTRCFLKAQNDISRKIVSAHFPDLDILPGDRRIAKFEDPLMMLSGCLKQMHRDFEIVVMDTCSEDGKVLDAALYCATTVLVPVRVKDWEPSVTINFKEKIKKLNPTAEIIIVPSYCPSDFKIDNMVDNDLNIFEHVLYEDDNFPESFAHRKTIFDYDPRVVNVRTFMFLVHKFNDI